MTVEAISADSWETVAFAARRLAVDVRSVKRWIGEGKLIGRELPGSAVRVSRASIDAMLASSIVKPTAAGVE